MGGCGFAWEEVIGGPRLAVADAVAVESAIVAWKLLWRWESLGRLAASVRERIVPSTTDSACRH